MTTTSRILFIGPHRPGRNPSQRFRMEQFFPFLADYGVAYDYSWYLSESDDAVLYKPGRWLRKGLIAGKAFFIRLRDVLECGRYDAVFIQREAYLLGTALFERWFRRQGVRVIFDFDDAIWLGDTSEANLRFRWLKRPEKVNDILRIADAVIAGNEFLATYARRYNENTICIPTAVDTRRLQPRKPHVSEQPLCIGWTGSQTTLPHFQMIFPVLKKIKDEFGDSVRLMAISDVILSDAPMPLEWKVWNAVEEPELTAQIDIGVMPLPDDDWARGKCGLKALQYMAVGAPAVVSPVGANRHIVRDGVTGYWAADASEWYEHLTRLITNPGLRCELGRQARQHVERHYSLQAVMPAWINVLLAR